MKLPFRQIVQVLPVALGALRSLIRSKQEPTAPSSPIHPPADRPGAQTSEWRMTIVGQMIALLIGVLAVMFPSLPSESLREVLLWIAGIVFGGVGGSYTLARAKVKAAALGRDTAVRVASINAARQVEVARELPPVPRKSKRA